MDDDPADFFEAGARARIGNSPAARSCVESHRALSRMKAGALLPNVVSYFAEIGNCARREARLHGSKRRHAALTSSSETRRSLLACSSPSVTAPCAQVARPRSRRLRSSRASFARPRPGRRRKAWSRPRGPFSRSSLIGKYSAPARWGKGRACCSVPLLHVMAAKAAIHASFNECSGNFSAGHRKRERLIQTSTCRGSRPSPG